MDFGRIDYCDQNHCVYWFYHNAFNGSVLRGMWDFQFLGLVWEDQDLIRERNASKSFVDRSSQPPCRHTNTCGVGWSGPFLINWDAVFRDLWHIPRSFCKWFQLSIINRNHILYFQNWLSFTGGRNVCSSDCFIFPLLLKKAFLLVKLNLKSICNRSLSEK